MEGRLVAVRKVKAVTTMPKCLRCGAGAEWIQGRVPMEPARDSERCSCAGRVPTSQTMITALRHLERERIKYPLLRQAIDELRSLLAATLLNDPAARLAHGAERDWA